MREIVTQYDISYHPFPQKWVAERVMEKDVDKIITDVILISHLGNLEI